MARRWKIALGLALALFALRAALPTIVTHVIEGQASSALGRAVEVENVDLSLLAGGIALEGLLVGPPLDPEAPPAAIDPETALIRWPHCRVDVGWLGLLSGELRIQRVTVRGARERLVLQADDRLEPLVVARPGDSEPPSAAPNSAESEETGEVPAADEGARGGGWPLRIEQLTLEDHAFLLIDAADASRPPVELDLAELTVGEIVLNGGRVSVGPVGLRSPRLRVRRDLQFAAEAEPETAAPGTPPPSEPPEAGATRLGFRLASFTIEDAQLGLLLDEGEFEVAMSLSVRDATLERNERFPVELRLTREDGWLEVAGDLGLAPIGFAGTVRWEDFPLVGLIAAADPEIPLALHAGSVAGDLTVELENIGGAEPGRASLRGRVAARQVGLRHDEEILKLDCGAFELVADEIEIPLQSDEPPKVALASVRIEKPAVKLVRRASAAGEEEELPLATEESSPASEAPRIAVGRLEVNGGTLQLIDESVEPTATTSLSKIRLAGSDLEFPARSGQLEADLRSIEGVSLQVAGDWQEGAGATTVALQKLQLGSYSPYLARAAGFEFTRGSLSLDGRIQSAGPKHEVKADLTFAKPALRDVKEGAFEKTFGMSAPTAVSLLTGPRGHIVLPLHLNLDEGGSGVDLRVTAGRCVPPVARRRDRGATQGARAGSSCGDRRPRGRQRRAGTRSRRARAGLGAAHTRSDRPCAPGGRGLLGPPRHRAGAGGPVRQGGRALPACAGPAGANRRRGVRSLRREELR